MSPGFRRQGNWGLCRGRFTREPDWAGMLRRAEEFGLWTLPDPDSIPYEPEPEETDPSHVRPLERGPRPRLPGGRPMRIQIEARAH